MSGSSTPNAVTNLQAGTPTTTAIPLFWQAPASGAAATAYEVDYSLANQNSWTTAATGIAATSYTISGLSASAAGGQPASYDVRVTPSNSAGAGQQTILQGVTLAAVPATTPTSDTGYFAPGLTEGLHRGAFMVREANGFLSREVALLANATGAAILYPAGLVVAVSGVPGAYVVTPYTASTTAGTQAGILFENRMVQPGQGLKVTFIAREAEVNLLELQFDASITSPALQAPLQQALLKSTIICR